MKLLGILLVTAALVLAAVLGGWWVAQVAVGPAAFDVPLLPMPRDAARPLLPTALPTAAPTAASKHVVCEGCDTAPDVSVSVGSGTTAGRVTQQMRYTPDEYTVLGGASAYSHDLVREILERQELGHLAFDVGIPAVGYQIQGTQTSSGTYTVRAKDVVVSGNPVVSVSFSIRYPILTNEQFNAVRGKKDYRFVYGLIDGIVHHEERHYRALTFYISEIVGILNAPLADGTTIAATSAADFQRKASALVSRRLEDRLRAAQAKHEAAQDAIDDPSKRARIEFVFEEEVNGQVPPPYTAEFIGEGTFSFELPPGPAPKPPKPNIPK